MEDEPDIDDDRELRLEVSDDESELLVDVDDDDDEEPLGDNARCFVFCGPMVFFFFFFSLTVDSGCGAIVTFF